MSATDGKLYLINLSNNEHLEFQFVPRELSLSRSPGVEDVQVVARNNPLQQWGGGNETLRFELDFHAEVEARDDVIKKVEWVKALTYADGNAKPAPRVQVVFGEVFPPFKWIVKNMEAKLELFDKLHGFLPRQAWVTLVLQLDPDTNLRTADVRYH